ncbi:long-chain fatty acid--CoA ligase [[Mycobacterium] crassicus]|uniref:Long-chain fatty acid--CoA ligase n=1 Tax=[Mycobacterium] crassicus TaxID=2872309 RepID=A0ABU5XLF4_9MYCO|nr:long-chain fatty acid--CoA ligase [Mycolicibacter sp. MYC098]MEB3022814.1 long-chain fatty acid--CoA ligase [Mycolicibacter sp. MYC098]
MDGLMMDQPLLLSDLLWRTERLFHDKKIVTYLEAGSYHSYTYADFAKRVRRLSSALVKLGVRPGERVGTIAWNHYRHFETYLGIPGSGAVVHTINMRLFPEQQQYIINHAGDSVLIVDEDQIPLIEQVAELGIPSVRAFVVMGDKPLPDTALAPIYRYEDLIADGDEDYEFPVLDERTAAAMCYTSATTGEPKGVVYSHRAMVLQTMCLAMHDKLNMSESQVWLEVSPMFHVNGWNIPHTALMQGATLVFPGVRPTAGDYVQIVQDQKITGMNGAVTIGTMMRDFIRSSSQEWDLSSLKTMWLGGQAPSRAIMEWWERYGTCVVQGYGSTENTPQVCFSSIKSTLANGSPEDIYALRQKQGQPIPLMKIKIMSDNGLELPWDGRSAGELWVQSPFTASAYYNDVRTKEHMQDGWFHTGDVGCIDPDGYVVIMDRVKDLIKSGGEWISSIDLENALAAHPKVREATVIAIPDEKWLERPLACVVADDKSLSEADLRAFLAERFAKWWIPDSFLIVDTIPKTSVGKFNKKELRALYSENGMRGIEQHLEIVQDTVA